MKNLIILALFMHTGSAVFSSACFGQGKDGDGREHAGSSGKNSANTADKLERSERDKGSDVIKSEMKIDRGLDKLLGKSEFGVIGDQQGANDGDILIPKSPGIISQELNIIEIAKENDLVLKSIQDKMCYGLKDDVAKKQKCDSYLVMENNLINKHCNSMNKDVCINYIRKSFLKKITN